MSKIKMKHLRVKRFKKMNRYESLVLRSIPDAMIYGEDGYHYMMERFPNPLDLKRISHDERITLCRDNEKLDSFFAAVQLGQSCWPAPIPTSRAMPIPVWSLAR